MVLYYLSLALNLRKLLCLSVVMRLYQLIEKLISDVLIVSTRMHSFLDFLPMCVKSSFYDLKVIVEKAERSDIPNIDKKK